jgi:hypothetical protein
MGGRGMGVGGQLCGMQRQAEDVPPQDARQRLSHSRCCAAADGAAAALPGSCPAPPTRTSMWYAAQKQ